ncbi:MAG TPA: hypothetical protein VKU60_03985 [Chloroflexota bacterium]|nr:hypothetical protein [Chloroflexota bacterium]
MALRLPEGPDSYELDVVVKRINAMVELRAGEANRDRAESLVAQIENDIEDALNSPTKHRDWKAARPRIQDMLDQLEQVLYYERPDYDDPDLGDDTQF